MNRRSAYIVLAALALAGGLVTTAARRGAGAVDWQEPDDARTLKFSHKFHIKEVGVACADCHAKAATSTVASDNLRSTHDNCTSCHEEQIAGNCGYCHADTANIQAALRPPRDFHFSHAKHVAMKGVECATCHKGLDEVDFATAKNMPSMSTCTTCHNNVTATGTCESCHTSFANLVPEDHLVADFKKEHKKRTRLGALDVTCSTCHTQTFCADCHDAPGLMQFGKDGLMSEPSPRNSPSDAPQQMPLQMVHSMNYRFTHGIDAKSKSSDCYSCHSARTFCVECHQTGDNITQKSFKPPSHLVPDFTTIGVGSGGGAHARLARRDIESCVSCHDVQGGDPTCITCHTDADGIRGTDPKTHVSGFMKNDHGPWHTDPGATCYNCHTDYNAHPGGTKGRNFCGYCHG